MCTPQVAGFEFIVLKQRWPIESNPNVTNCDYSNTYAFATVLQLDVYCPATFNRNHTLLHQRCYFRKMISRDRSLDYRCTICGAAKNEECESHSGNPRFESHPERLEAVSVRDFFRKRVTLPTILLRSGGTRRPTPPKLQVGETAKLTFRPK
jgi:hypothetical protein